MDPLTLLALTALAIAVTGYIVYLAVRRGVRDGIKGRDAERAREQTEPEVQKEDSSRSSEGAIDVYGLLQAASAVATLSNPVGGSMSAHRGSSP
ncbi:hypothetical protein [Brachybacterium vulturis]|uniref:hypothetical protein n=1 Tax=Brachybacterium vulturis TaxID=2017484 RepID=UPI003736A933